MRHGAFAPMNRALMSGGGARLSAYGVVSSMAKSATAEWIAYVRAGKRQFGSGAAISASGFPQ